MCRGSSGPCVLAHTQALPPVVVAINLRVDVLAPNQCMARSCGPRTGSPLSALGNCVHDRCPRRRIREIVAICDSVRPSGTPNTEEGDYDGVCWLLR
jgi:hypothetical protein